MGGTSNEVAVIKYLQLNQAKADETEPEDKAGGKEVQPPPCTIGWNASRHCSTLDNAAAGYEASRRSENLIGTRTAANPTKAPKSATNRHWRQPACPGRARCCLAELPDRASVNRVHISSPARQCVQFRAELLFPSSIRDWLRAAHHDAISTPGCGSRTRPR